MSVATARTPTEYEERFARYRFERAEEFRAVRVGEKETSEQAAIVERYHDLFTPAQLDALRDAELAASGDERELVHRLRKTCEAGLIASELAAREDELENRYLAARIDWDGEELPLRSAQAKLAVLPAYRDRDELGALHNARNATFNEERAELLAAGEALEAELSGIADPVARNEDDKGISLRELERTLDAASRAAESAYRAQRERWFERLLGPERDDVPTSSHMPYMRRLSPLEATYTRERAVPVCVETLRRLGFDIETRRASGSTSTTDRRNRRGPASSPRTRPTSST